MITTLDLIDMENTQPYCFVCDNAIQNAIITYQRKVNLPVCDNCKDTANEKAKIEELLEGLADGFVCGCI